jgi:hypothetical protein
MLTVGSGRVRELPVLASARPGRPSLVARTARDVTVRGRPALGFQA